MSAGEAALANEHLRIPPWLRPVARPGGEVQFGVSPGGPIVTGVTEAEAAVLALLDGALSLRTSYQLAARAGIPAARWRALLELMHDIGVLDGPTERKGATERERATEREPGGQLVVDGRGPLVDEVVVLLRRGGLDLEVRAEAELTAAGAGAPALVVLMESPTIDPRRGDAWQRRGVPHLPVIVAGPQATVGPLITPLGPGPCLWCLDLHRSDRDRAWPTVVARLCADTGAIVPAPSARLVGDPLLSQLVSASIGLLARGHLEGRPTPPGVSVDLQLPWPRLDHRRWTVHPHCSRHAAARVA